MRIFPLKDESGDVKAFEVPNWKLSRRRAANIVDRVPGVGMELRPKWPFPFGRTAVFCRFSLNGRVFEIEEPFGDNSRYLVCEADGARGSPELDQLMEAYKGVW
jgi:hypothetical protein